MAFILVFVLAFVVACVFSQEIWYAQSSKNLRIVPQLSVWWLNDGRVFLELADYPAEKLGFSLDRMSVSGKYHRAPSELKPQAGWRWGFSSEVWPGVKLLLERAGVRLEEKTPQETQDSVC